jgi:hypothetical protein
VQILPLVVLSALAVAGCGYHFPGQASSLPGGGTKLHVTTFRNQTREAGLEFDVQEALEDEVARRGSFQIVPKDQAEAVLEGVIQSLQLRPIAFSNTDEAVQYETIVTVSAVLKDPRNEMILWRVTNLTENDSYGAVPQTVVVQSSQFQEQSTLNQANLLQLTDVQLSEAQKREALERVVDNISRDVYNSMVENF